MSYWVFVLSFWLPVFGGPVILPAITMDQKGCEALHRVADIQLQQTPFAYKLTECWRADWADPMPASPTSIVTDPTIPDPNTVGD